MCIVYLVGIKHSGKSSVGRQAVELLHKTRAVEFTDTDNLIHSLLPSPYFSIREFYRHAGAAAFRELELRALQTWLDQVSPSLHVVALGGGACDNEPLIQLMQSSGIIIYLAVEESVLLQRILQHGIPPFLSAEDPRQSFHTLYERRNSRYRQFSDYVLQLYDCRSIPENAEILAKTIQKIAGKRGHV